MNFERLRWGEWIAALAALNLLFVVFRAWYKVSGGDGRVTAWDALESGRYLLIVTAVIGVLLLVLIAAEQAEQMSFPPGALAAAAGLASTVYIAYRLATPPADTLDADIGLFVGLASALGVAIGGLLSMRDQNAAPAYEAPGQTHDATAGPSGPGGATGPGTGGSAEWSPAPPAPSAGWSPAAPAASSAGWSPAAPSAPVPPATPAGAGFGGGDRPLQSGDQVALTAGGARFPAGTLARVVEVFGGGALVEVAAPDGVAERFEVPEDAYERVGAGGPPTEATSPSTSGESWSPAMPAPAQGNDWGFDESAAAGTGAVGGAAAGAGLAAGGAEESQQEKKVPFWKREIGGKKKRDADSSDGDSGGGSGVAAGAAAGAAGAVAAASMTDERSEERPGFFKRLFGGGKSDQQEDGSDGASTETLDAQDTESFGAQDPDPAPFTEPEPVATSEPDVAAPDADPALEPDPVAVDSDPIPPAPESEPVSEAPAAVQAGPEPPAPEPTASEPVVEATPDPPAPEPVVEATPEPEPSAPEAEPTPAADVAGVGPAAESDTAIGESASVVDTPGEADAPATDALGADAAAAGGAAAGAVGAGGTGEDAAETPKPKRKRSSGSRKVPKEALDAAAGSQPKVGDEVQLKVGGGKYDAGTRGRVVDVFSAGVIVELSDAEGRTERLDLPFEAVGPADA